MRRASGFTLLEVLIAATIGVVLVTSAGELLVSARDWQRSEQAYSRGNDQARLLRSLLGRALRSAGDPGCHWDYRRNLTQTPVYTPQPAIGNPTDAATPSGSEALVIHHLRPLTQAMLPSAPSRGADLVIDREHALAFGEPVVLAADAGATCVVFYQSGYDAHTLYRGSGAADDLDGGALNRVPEGGYWPFAGRVTLYVPERTVFYVDDSVAGESKSLFRKRLSANNRREELLVGVKALQIRYALRRTGDHGVDDWVGAAAVSDWHAVVGVRIQATLTPRPSAPANSMRSVEITQALRNGWR